MDITLVIPTFNTWEFTDSLIDNVSRNTVIPKEIILIDDGSDIKGDYLIEKYKTLPIIYVRNEKNFGVNYSWNLGISLTDTEFISVLNNDILINKYFFSKIIESFNIDDKISIVCPNTVKNISVVDQSKDEPVILDKIKKREGWAWSSRMSFLNKIKPIPDFLRTYCGDDYIFYYSNLLGYKNRKILNNYIYHFGGKSININESCWDKLKVEKDLWNKYKKSIIGGCNNES